MLALFLVYVVVEVATLVWLGTTVGIAWTIVLLLAGSLVGMTLVRSQGRRVLTEFSRANRGEIAPSGPVADGMLVGVGAILLFVPGLVTTVFGLLLMIPPTRRLLRPIVGIFMMRMIARSQVHAATGPGGTNSVVIDGEIARDTTPNFSKYGGLTIQGGAPRTDSSTGDDLRRG